MTVLQLVAGGDVGRAVNKLLCRGQDEGAALMGLAQALFEEMRYEDGVLLNGEALDYRVPMAEDLPARFVSITQEQGHGPGPFGAKGAGEGAMVPVAAAVANAVHDAAGARDHPAAAPGAGVRRLAGAAIALIPGETAAAPPTRARQGRGDQPWSYAEISSLHRFTSAAIATRSSSIESNFSIPRT
ncbi:molybdopterin cofactor-binding domain-containing protein [Streptomyces sp. NPDC050423]|uniref:molybdopterin cofactor-binding domain-containing protein n=1 Tax=Streptomyces sp. NPDC050423 TaxID=3155402 RepID=UPI00342EDB6C